MPRVTIPIDNTDATITRLVAKSVIDQILFLTDISVKDVIYNERGNIAATQQLADGNEPLKLDTEDYAFVNYEEKYTTGVIDSVKNKDITLPIFSAPELGIRVAPLHARTDLILRIKLRTKSFNDLSKWLSQFRLMLATRSAANQHDIKYNYTLPIPLIGYLSNVYELTETVAPLGKTLTEFIEQHFTRGILVRHNLSDTERRLAINVNNIGCLGIYSDLPEIIETEKEPPVSEISFTYKLTYDKVTHVTIDYQEFVHNQRVSTEYLRSFIIRSPVTRQNNGDYDVQGKIIPLIENYNQLDINDVFFMPEDTWLPKTYTPETSIILMIPVQLDPNNLTAIFNLNEITDFRLPVDLLSILTLYFDRITDQYRFPILIELFSSGTLETPIPIVSDNTLTLTSTANMDLKLRYYLRISIVNDLSQIDMDFLRDDYLSLIYLLRLLDPTIDTVDLNNTLTVLGNGSYVTEKSLENVISNIKETNKLYKIYHDLHRYYTVANNTIIVGAK